MALNSIYIKKVLPAVDGDMWRLTGQAARFAHPTSPPPPFQQLRPCAGVAASPCCDGQATTT